MATKTKKQKKQNYSSIFAIVGVILIIGIVGFFFLKRTITPTYSQTLAEIYTGELPCADCSGIMTTLHLTKDSESSQKGTYVLSEIYEGKTTEPIVTNGTWKITQGDPSDPHAFILTLTQNNTSTNTYYHIDSESRLTMLDQQKGKIDAPFNESLTAQSSVQLTETQTKIVSQLPSWMPTASWKEPLPYQQQTFYGSVAGSEVTGTVTAKEATVPHFENSEFLQSLGFMPDTNLSADGPGSSVWGYAKETNGKKQIVLFSYQTRPTSINPNEPLQFTCPCKLNLGVYISN